MEALPTPEAVPRIISGSRENQPPRAWVVVDENGTQSHLIVEGMNVDEALNAARKLGLRFLMTG